MFSHKSIAEDTITVFTFPLPSPTNYALLANLITILSHVYTRVIVVSGGFTTHIEEVIDEIKYAKNNIYIYDIGLKLPQRDHNVSKMKGVITYIKIQIKLIVATLKLRSEFRTALLFIGLPHLLTIIILLRLFKKRVMVY